jgi:hypothetical protein
MFKKSISIALASLFAVATATSTLSASDITEKQAKKGSKVYQKKFKSRCDNMTGAAFAGQYDMDEWQELYEEGELASEIKEVCPATESMKIKERDLKKLYHFFYFYGADSGKVPSCG